jgi:negative regulator of flagellin synthesis FlgM
MSSFEIGATRPVGAIQIKTVAATPAAQAPVETKPTASQALSTAAQVETSDAVKAGSAPVDTDRVETIRKAVQEGKYPVVPARIADAMIAAGMLLRSPQ